MAEVVTHDVLILGSGLAGLRAKAPLIVIGVFYGFAPVRTRRAGTANRG